MLRRKAVAAGLVALSLLLPTSAASAEEPVQGPPLAGGDGTVRTWLDEANYVRSFLSLQPGPLIEDPALSLQNQKHAYYDTQNNTCGHSENPSNPFYTEDGNFAAAQSVLFCGAVRGAQAVDGWTRTPLHGEQVVNPQLNVTGFSDSYQRSGMNTLTHRDGRPALARPVTWPSGYGVPFRTYLGQEIPDPLVACPGYTSAGLPLFAFLPPAAASQPGTATFGRADGTALPFCLLKRGSVNGSFPYMSAAILMPRDPLQEGTRYVGTYAAGGVTATWDFTTSGGSTTRAAPPTNVLSSGSGGVLDVSWTAPASSPAPITSYVVTTYPDGIRTTVAGSQTTAQLTGLSSSFANATVTAVTSAGPGLPSIASATTALRPPSASSLRVQAGDRALDVVVLNTTDDMAVLRHEVTVHPQDSPSTVTTFALPPGKRSLHVDNLVNGKTYILTVVTRSAAGTGQDTNSYYGYPATVPGAPTNLAVEPVANGLTVSWQAPADDGGSSIQGYAVEIRGADNSYSHVFNVTSPYTLTDRAPGVYHSVKVTARNSRGTSAPATSRGYPLASDGSVITNPPASTGKPSATTGDGTAALTWAAPEDDGNSPVTSYQVAVMSPSGSTAATVSYPADRTQTGAAVRGLTNGFVYHFEVRAVNARGPGQPSFASGTPTGPPLTPGGVVARPGRESASVAFTPGGDGGSAITGFTVTASPGGQHATGSTSPVLVTGLTAGQDYTFTVRATNALGSSAESATSSPVTPTPRTAPAAPGSVVATAQSQAASVTFAVPDDGGSAITRYTVTSTPGGITGTGTSSPVVVSGLSNGTAYTFAVAATNELGTGPSSDSSSPVTPATQTPAHLVPRVTVNPFVVRFGQTANVTIHGTPGATVDLYIRKYLQTFVKIRQGLVLDTAGKVVVPTKPDVNLRFMAKDRTVEQGSSIGGTSGLMTVEKTISINARRDGVRRFTFTGTVAPNHPGATVSLFRSGTLVRSGIPVNSARVYSFTSSQPAGNYIFQVRSGATGYNAASSSPARSVRIF